MDSIVEKIVVFFRKTILIILFVIVSSSTIHAGSTHDKLSLTLYTKSGIEKLTEQISPLVLSSFDQTITRDQNTANLPKSILSQIRAGIPESFSETFIKNEILSYIKEMLTEKEIRTVLKWLDSPLGKRFTKLEEEATKVNLRMKLKGEQPKFSVVKDEDDI